MPKKLNSSWGFRPESKARSAWLRSGDATSCAYHSVSGSCAVELVAAGAGVALEVASAEAGAGELTLGVSAGVCFALEQDHRLEPKRRRNSGSAKGRDMGSAYDGAFDRASSSSAAAEC